MILQCKIVPMLEWLRKSRMRRVVRRDLSEIAFTKKFAQVQAAKGKVHLAENAVGAAARMEEEVNDMCRLSRKYREAFTDIKIRSN